MFREACAVIQFLWSEGLKPSKIHRRMEAVPLGGKVPKWQNEHWWWPLHKQWTGL